MSGFKRFKQFKGFLVKSYRRVYRKVCKKSSKPFKPFKPSGCEGEKQPLFTAVGGYITPTPPPVNKSRYLVVFIMVYKKRKNPVPYFVAGIGAYYGR